MINRVVRWCAVTGKRRTLGRGPRRVRPTVAEAVVWPLDDRDKSRPNRGTHRTSGGNDWCRSSEPLPRRPRAATLAPSRPFGRSALVDSHTTHTHHMHTIVQRTCTRTRTYVFNAIYSYIPYKHHIITGAALRPFALSEWRRRRIFLVAFLEQRRPSFFLSSRA